MTSVIAIVFFGFLVLGMPIAFVLGVTGLVAILKLGTPGLLELIPIKVYNGIDIFPLMAMPLFILAGDIMNRTGITNQLVRLAQSLVGHMRGGLAHANIVAEIFFSGITGSAVADASALGTLLIPAMQKEGYPKGFSAALVRTNRRSGIESTPGSGRQSSRLTRGRLISCDESYQRIWQPIVSRIG